MDSFHSRVWTNDFAPFDKLRKPYTDRTNKKGAPGESDGNLDGISLQSARLDCPNFSAEQVEAAFLDDFKTSQGGIHQAYKVYMITKYLPLIGAFNVSMIYLISVGGVIGAMCLFAATKVLGNIIFPPADKVE